MTTQRQNQNCSKDGHRDVKQPDDRSRGCFLKASSMSVHSRVEPSDDRRGICRFEIQNHSKGEHYDPTWCHPTKQGAGR